MATLDERMFSEFEDIQEDSDANKSTTDDLEDNYMPDRKIAKEMNHNELMSQLKDRGAPIKGFEDEDAETLQKLLDVEYDEELETKRKERREAKALAAKQAGLQKRRMLMEGQIQEEQIEIEKDHRIEFWLHLVRTNQTPRDARISLNGITSRSLAKALWDNSSIISLDVSRMKLSDLAGAYISRALRSNRSIIKLDLESNYFGPKTCKSLADALTTNTTVTHVNLESNLLTKGSKGNDLSGVEAIADMLKQNTTLVYLNMWRCSVASEGGHRIVTGLAENDTIIFLELGHNGLTQSQEKRVADKLDENKEQFEMRQEVRRAEDKKAAAEAAVRKAAEDEKAKKEELKQWMHDQKVSRARERAEQLEEEAAKERAEAAQRRLEEEEKERKDAEAAAAAAAKKAKKKGKK
jgi:hypothetical protein